MRVIHYHKTLHSAAAILLALCLVPPVLSLTEKDVGYELVWTTVTASGTSSGGDYVLGAVVGEPLGGNSAGGDYEMRPAIEPAIRECRVNFDHVETFAEHWLGSGAGTWVDLDGSGMVDFLDYTVLADGWLECCPIGWQ
ncbi:MAG: hypothetical protein ISS79_11005 [Phycisphaerae bacterium]|nr:hypothetical protein [Phycisphaerae bacterium]